jgi:hypothetical protein
MCPAEISDRTGIRIARMSRIVPRRVARTRYLALDGIYDDMTYVVERRDIRHCGRDRSIVTRAQRAETGERGHDKRQKEGYVGSGPPSRRAPSSRAVQPSIGGARSRSLTHPLPLVYHTTHTHTFTRPPCTAQARVSGEKVSLPCAHAATPSASQHVSKHPTGRHGSGGIPAASGRGPSASPASEAMYDY